MADTWSAHATTLAGRLPRNQKSASQVGRLADLPRPLRRRLLAALLRRAVGGHVRWQGVLHQVHGADRHPHLRTLCPGVSLIMDHVQSLTASWQAALFLASCATLVTTVPPRPDIVDYTMRGPHILLWASFNVLCTSIIVAGGDVYLIYACGPDTIYDVRPTL